MAQRGSPQKSSAKAAQKATAKLGGTTSGALRPGAAGGRPPVKKPGRSIVNQRQTPWGLIVTAIVIVLFAGGIVAAVVVTHKSKAAANGGCSQMIGSNSTSYLNELKCAADIQGVKFQAISDRQHVNGVVQYSATPPIGGNHSPVWADCNGHVYTSAIANENAVHMLEHGAVWITYKPGLDTSQISTLSSLVIGNDRMAMSPYPGQTANISLQAWGYQLQVDNASDPRIQKFITALRYNAKTTPEYSPGVVCSDPYFLQNLSKSTPGHPIDS
ncbi:MAG TPA: DUF3105 domain-containing protein [Jatrophihabitantaceae bacterium]|nr:DUF3105 domain-containing protein [Jatrophihabitantaceae bacterium]